MTDNPSGLATALAELQTSLPRIEKSETAEVQTKAGGTYRYTYANLANLSDQILPLLGKLGLSFTCRPTLASGQFVLSYRLWHTSGDFIEGEYPLPTGGTPQSIGSAITYGRRYCLCAVTGVAPEDDDDGATAEARALARRGDGTAQRAPEKAARKVQRTQTSPDEGPEMITSGQRGMLMKLFNDRGTDRPERLRISSRIVGRELASANELTKAEAHKVIDALESDTVQEAEPPAEDIAEPDDNPGFGDQQALA